MIQFTICDKLGNMSQWQVAHIEGINNAGYFYTIQSEFFNLKTLELPFNNESLPCDEQY